MAAQDRFLSTCDPHLTPLVARRAKPFTPRRAADSSGNLGSFYDACCDQVLEPSNLKFVTKSAQARRPPSCRSETCTIEESSNLLKWCNMHDELRLSIALQMVQGLGEGALINYSYPVDKYTRFIFYQYYSRTDYLSDDDFESLTRNKSPIPDTPATHVIVLINWSVAAVAVLQLPSDDERVAAIDYVIRKICVSLNSDKRDLVLSEEDLRVLEEIRYTNIFSNVSELSTVKSINEFRRKIPRIKDDTSLHKPYNYNLCPIRHLYTVKSEKQNIFIEIPLEYLSMIENYLLLLSNKINGLRRAMDRGYPNLEQHAKDLFTDIDRKWSQLDQMYMREIERLRRLVLGIRRGMIEYKRINEALDDGIKRELNKNTDDFENDLNIIKKEYFIADLSRKGFDYRNAIEYDVKKDDDEQTIERKLLSNNKNDRIICFNNTLYDKKKSQWDNLVAQLLEEQKKNSQLRLIIVDFSYCSHNLKRFLIVRETENDNNATASTTREPSPQSKPFETSTESKPLETSIESKPIETSSQSKPRGTSSQLKPSKSDGTINILLLGESGVGKSTFINAFANYLTFNRMKQAQRKPVVLIPVSFIMTSGHTFEEQRVTFGNEDDFSNEDDLSNEDHSSLGQSVTQHCKSYVFTLQDDDNSGRRLRIIDTPGIGDVRGMIQDDTNMQHILLYMNNLTHLDAVCVLMKPNNARLNVFFRSCLIQLFDLLGEDARDNIIFCFTNSRATFYTPGNTGPLLKNLLQSLPVKNVPFGKHNTFCFDSESFRYLVAKRNGIEFSSDEEKDYQSSWERSSEESKRFLKCICNQESSLFFLAKVDR